jgi:trans-aconitate 2-methyltransferase
MSWRPDEAFELVLSNACFHWIDDHARLLDHLESMMAPTATLAFQVPSNHDRPSHLIVAELTSEEPWLSLLGGPRPVNVEDPEWYSSELKGRGFAVVVWQTVYHHRLEGTDPVLEWLKGTTLRPTLDRLDAENARLFLDELATRLRTVYPAVDGVTHYPFTRTFVVAGRSAP